MSAENDVPVNAERSVVKRLWRQAPTAYKAGVLVATFGWFLHLSIFSKSTHNGEITACSYLDLGQLALAALLVVTAIYGPIANRRARDPLPGRLAAGLSLAFVVAAAIMTARGLGWGSDYCTTDL
jgi:hypothetical protein